jgi:hypothetical protein
MNFLVSEEELVILAGEGEFPKETVADFLKSKKPVEEITDSVNENLWRFKNPNIKIFIQEK